MREKPEQRQVGGGTPSGGALQPRGALGALPSHPRGRGGSQTPGSGMPGGKSLPAHTSAGRAGWTGPAGPDCQIAGMQGRHTSRGRDRGLAGGASLKSLRSNLLSLFISSEHEAELGTEVPAGTEGTRCVVSWPRPR